MAFNNNPGREYEKERDLWNAQSKNSFVKAKLDYMNGTDFDSRLHLSFVEHTGKPKCEQKANIEVGIPMVKGGSDGSGNSGITALGLAAMITNGALEMRSNAERAEFEQRRKTSQGGPVYHRAIWACIGGTTASRSHNGKPEFRKVEILPGLRLNSYALCASSCEGETSTALGGVQPKKDATWTRITVPVDSEYMFALAETIRAIWNAHQASMLQKAMDKRANRQPNQQPYQNNQPAPPAPAPMPAPATAPAPIAKKPERVWSFYDNTHFGPLASAVSEKSAIAYLKKCLKKLETEKGLYARQEDVDRLANAILNGMPDRATKKNFFLPAVPLFVMNSQNPKGDDTLGCMEFSSVG